METAPGPNGPRPWNVQRLGRWIAAAFFVFTGSAHFLRPEPFLAIMPPDLPAHRALVAISGACEIAGGLGLLVPAVARAAAWGLVALLIAVFPANIHMAVHHIQFNGFPSEPWMAWARLPFQLVFIAWVLWCTSPPPRADGSPTHHAG